MVVQISRDSETGCGTGFYISPDLVATCYHVLARQNENLQSHYYIRHDNWKSWEVAEPLLEYCFPPAHDVAILNVSRKLQDSNILRIENWIEESNDFRSRGYDRDKRVHGIGATTVEGNVVGFTTYKGYPRLQLRTRQGTIRQGRSGSPVWSCQQQVVVGMIDWLGETLEADSYELVLAVPIEHIMPSRYKNQKLSNKGQSKNTHEFYNSVCRKCGCSQSAFELFDWPCQPK